MIRAALALAAALTLATVANAQASHTAAVQGHTFLVDNRPFQILSAAIHYERIPRADWPDRLAKLKAMGLNSVETYVFWNAHEPTPGHFDFTGQNDIAAFLRDAQRAGLFVLLRPGPYICAEWELGGYPSWLLKSPAVVLRSQDPRLTAATDRWFTELGKQIKPLLLQNGGPILATQVENEYGSFADNHAYMEQIHHMLLAHDLAAPILYTADGPLLIPRGGLPELPAVINFGTGDARESFAQLDKLRPAGPRMTGEYWAGWFDHWGDPHETRSATDEADEITWMLAQGFSMNLYMGDGGTSFGWRNGANSNGTNYQPDTTSYDYDAPIAENGDLTPKYFAFQKAFRAAQTREPSDESGTHAAQTRAPSTATGAATTEARAPSSATGAPTTQGATPARAAEASDLPAPAAPSPTTMPRTAYPITSSNLQSASLWDNLPKPVQSPAPLAMEDLDQAYGDILYAHTLPANTGGDLTLHGLHDYAQIYLDRQLVGTLDRRDGSEALTLPASNTPRKLEILVENTGRVNFTAVIRTERKGITGAVTLAGAPLTNWTIYSLPFTGPTDPTHFRYSAAPCSGPCFFRAIMSVPAQHGDRAAAGADSQAGPDSPAGQTSPASPASTATAAGPDSQAGPADAATPNSQAGPADAATPSSQAAHLPDTYLNLSGNSKGFVWINDQPLGRFWSIGPQYSLWTPGAWLHPGDNTVLLYDMRATGTPHLSTAQNWLAAPTLPAPATQ